MDVQASSPLFCTLGMVVLDEIHLPGGRILRDVAGGSCAFSTLGARLAVEDDQAQRVACYVLAGEDFPGAVEQQLQRWGIDLVVQKRHGLQSTRAKLQYHDQSFSSKTFGYMTPPLQPAPEDLPRRHLAASAFHILAGPGQIHPIVKKLLQARETAGETKRPLLVWEPLPMHCRPNDLLAHVKASKLVDIFSPNHLELDALCGRLKSTRERAGLGRGHVENCVSALFGDHPDAFQPHQLCIIRAGEHGVLVAKRRQEESKNPLEMIWVDPYHRASDDSRIVDVTGAGNAFLGAFAVDIQQNGGDAIKAAIKASVAASFAVEQVGLPSFRPGTGDRPETWNDSSMSDRIREYTGRTRLSIV